VEPDSTAEEVEMMTSLEMARAVSTCVHAMRDACCSHSSRQLLWWLSIFVTLKRAGHALCTCS
jgi:hypothetical protein